VVRLPLSMLAKLAGQGDGYGGAVSLRLKGHGRISAPAGELTVKAHGASGPNFPATDGTLTAAYAPATGRGDLDLRVVRGGQTLSSAEAQVRLPPGQLPDLAALTKAPLQARLALGPLEVQKIVPGGTSGNRLQRLRGRLEAQAQLSGTLADPRARVAARLLQVQLGGVSLGEAQLNASYQTRKAQAQVQLTSANQGRLQLDTSTTLDLSLPSLQRGLKTEKAPLQAHLQARGFDLALFSGLSDVVPVVGGTLEADARVSGTIGDPRPSGRLAWRDGRLAITGSGRYRQIQLSVRGDQQKIVLEKLSAVSGRGNANLTAQATARTGAPGYDVQAQAKTRDFPIYSAGQAIARLSLDASVRGAASTREVQLTTKVDEARVQMVEGADKSVQSMARPEDVIILRNGEPLNRDQERRWERLIATREQDEQPGAAARARGEQPFAVRLQVDAPRNLWVTGSDVSLELGVEPGFTVNLAEETRVYGTVMVRRGYVTVIGRRFDLKPSSTVRFSGLTDRPELDVDAVYQARKANMTVMIGLEGTPDNLKISVSSPEQPQLTEGDLLAVIVTGRRPDERSNSTVAPTDRAASLVGSLLANRIQRVLSRKLPIDVLNIEPGEGVTGPRLEAGTYLTDDLYVAYVARMGVDPFSRTNRNEVHLEYQISGRWSFAGTYGDARRGSGDIVWTKHF
jgi:translocation and assembly module TamB